VLLVSHDRALLDAVGARTVAIEEGKLHSYEGGWADYVRAREEKRAAEERKTEDGRRKTGKRAAPKPKPKLAKSNGGEPSKNQKKRIAALEREIEKAEAALAAVEDELADPSAWASPTSSARSTERHLAAKKAVEELYAQLEAAGA
jgi:ATP-binding cassette subfamily F protein 3